MNCSRIWNLAAILCTSALGIAQGQVAGLGRVTRERIDLEALTTNVQSLGVAYLNGLAYVSSRGGNGGVTVGPHSIYVIEPTTGTLVTQGFQAGAVHTQVWGFRDGTTDGVSLMFGNDDGIYVCDPTSIMPGVDIALATTVIAANGPQVLTANPIAGPGLAAIGNIYRGIAYDPNGNGGNGSIWAGNFGEALIEIDLDGNVLTTFPVPAAPNAWSIYGLAFDDRTGNLWANSAPNAGDIAEIDTTTGLPTGARIQKTVAGATQGGLAYVPGGLDGRNCGADLLCLDQGDNTSPGVIDAIAGYRVHQWNNVDFADEARMLIGSAGVIGDGFAPIAAGAGSGTIDWGLGGAPGTPFAAFINLEPASLTFRPAGGLAPGFFNSLWELRRDLGQVVIVNGVAGVPQQVAAGPLPLGEIAIQAVSLDPRVIDAGCGVSLGLAVSNERRWVIEPPSIKVRCFGADSFNTNTTFGFFSVENLIGQNIASVQFSFFGSSQPTKEFDTDQTGMADNFHGGNSMAAGCQGTYRNNCDVVTGLVYPGTDVSNCDATAQTGFIGSDAIGTVRDWQTLTFSFADFGSSEKFEFDCDTDGGGAINGSGMAGMIVTITLADSTVLTGTIAADPVDVNLGALQF